MMRSRTDREAFGRLYDIYYPRIFRHCLRRLFLRSVAEDVTSDIFLQVARKIPPSPPGPHTTTLSGGFTRLRLTQSTPTCGRPDGDYGFSKKRLAERQFILLTNGPIQPV